MPGSKGKPDDNFVDRLLNLEESSGFEVKRIAGKLNSALESIVAFANTDGGLIAIGLEDASKAKGHDRVYGIQEKMENWDELRRLIKSRITDERVLPLRIIEIPCTLRDNSIGSIAVLHLQKSSVVHSIIDDGTWIRMEKSNRELTAKECHELMFERGAITAENQLVDVDFELLDTEIWKNYAAKRRFTRSVDKALYHIGLAKKNDKGILRPTRAAVLLFAEHPEGLLSGKATIRIFHYKGDEISTDPQTNLIRPPLTVSGSLYSQIQNATESVTHELAQGIQMGPYGFEIVQKYPLRVIKEAITNAVIHRDYHLNGDIHIRIFSDRIEVESPGLLIGPVTPRNINTIGTYSRNSLIVNALRDFPNPPNIDAGEGVRMMFGTMQQANLYPPLYITKPQTGRDSVRVVLFNQYRPTIWEQVSKYIDKHGAIANRNVRAIMKTDDTLKASKMLKEWVEKGLLVVANPDAGTRYRQYAKPMDSYLSRLINSILLGKEEQ